MLAVGYFYQVEQVSIPRLLWILIMIGCWILSKTLSASIDRIMWLFCPLMDINVIIYFDTQPVPNLASGSPFRLLFVLTTCPHLSWSDSAFWHSKLFQAHLTGHFSKGLWSFLVGKIFRNQDLGPDVMAILGGDGGRCSQESRYIFMYSP